MTIDAPVPIYQQIESRSCIPGLVMTNSLLLKMAHWNSGFSQLENGGSFQFAMLVYQRVSTNGEPCNKQRLHQLTMTFFSCRAGLSLAENKQTQSFRHQSPINGTILHWMPTAMVTTSPPKGRACYNVVCHMSGCWRNKLKRNGSRWLAPHYFDYLHHVV